LTNKIVVIYGSGASHASGYMIRVPVNGNTKLVKPLMDKDYFNDDTIKSLIESEYGALKTFIELYFDRRNDITLEELWTAVDLNHKHITLDTYDWKYETSEYQCRSTLGGRIHRYEKFDLEPERGRFYTHTGYFNKYKFLGDCGRNLKELIYHSLSDIIINEKVVSNYSRLHEYIKNNAELIGYITFNYDLILEQTLRVNNALYRYPGVNEDVTAIAFLKKELPIAKLHGSLNWEFRPTGQPVIYKERPIQPEYNSPRDYIEPAIIPPTLFKQEINDDRRISDPLTQSILHQWKAAIRLLFEANKLIIVGYSFPPTDFHALRIFQIAMMRKRANKEAVKILYCGGSDDQEVKRGKSEELQRIFMIKQDEITIKNRFESLCDSKELEKFIK
jgi:hypothetical protein